MSDSLKNDFNLPPEQQAMRNKCFHPSETFIEFPIEDVETSIPARFEKIVRQYPDDTAIKIGDRKVTYAELNAMANRVARRIISERGTEPEPVGLLIGKGAEQIAAMLGVLKAGKFFVLFDPSFPLERNSAILKDTFPRSTLVDAKNMPYGSKLTNTLSSLIAIESIDPNSASDDLKLEISPDSLAYIVYTSGSTGKPKGVIQNHRSRLHLVMVYSKMLSLTHKDRCILLTSGTANTIANSLYALLNGAALHPFNVNELGLSRLAGWIIEEKISICAISAPLFRKLCESLTGKEKFSDLRVLRLTSEASYKSDFELYKRLFPRTCRLANMLAPTEAGMLRQFLMDHDTQINGDEIPLGYPVDDTEIFLLDEEGREVGCNEVGEIVVRSRYLSCGYWLRPELNEAKFKADPRQADQRLYYTGDIGLMLPDGCLIHKGRKDFRVKIRGYGVETAEVEKVLRGHASVKDCIVVDRKGESGDTKLIAYYTSSAQSMANASELRNFLSRSLPDYMVPSMFVKLDAIPLTPNGKVNRAALPAPTAIRPELNVPYAAPTNEWEARLTRIWCDVLGLGFVGIHDNFFELGGDSLSAMRVVARIRSGLHAEVPFVEFYEAPTISALAALLQRSPKVKLGVQAAPIERRERAHPIPLSLGQERLWFLEQLEPHAHRYNLVAGFRLHGSLDATALEWAINEIIKRHESLRTVFDSADGKPFQVVLDAASISVPVVDIAPKPTETIERALCRMCADEAQRPFDLARGPLLRTMIVKADGQLIALVLVIHHLVFDGWSMDIFARELPASYEAAINRQPVQLGPLPIQYADFAMWQRDCLQSQDLDSHLSYWRNRLAGISDLQLPTDRLRPPFRDGRATRQWFTIAPSVTRSLKDTSGKAGVTMFMTLLAAYQTLLYRYSGQDDICVGVPVAGRQDEALDNAIGFFLNMLVLRADLSGNPTFLDLLGRVRGRCVEAYDHQDIPFERLVEELQPRRMVNHHPLFQASFALRHGGACALRLRGLEVQELEIDPGISRFDLELYMEEREQGLHGFIAGSADLFDASTIDRMVGHFVTLLKGIVADPEQRVSELSLLSEAEKHQLLVEWNDTRRDYPTNKCTHEMFEAQVEKTPDAIAVVFGDQQLSYRELNNRANQLAHHLKKLGIGPDMLVGICLERSVEMIVGLLAILKAGGAYVPLDPSYPEARLGLMLEDAHAGMVLTDRVSLKSLPATEARVICLDQDWEEIAKEPQFNPSSQSTADSLAYVIYTSGSTGLPKGVEVRHQGVARLLFGVDYVQLDEAQTFLHLAPISFDAATFEVWGALLHGGKCVLFPGEVPSPRELGEVLKKHRVSTLWLTAALFNTVIDEAPQALSEIKQLLIGGEALSLPHVKKGLGQLPNTKIINGYGPTESTTFTCCYPIPRQLDDNLSSIPIGRPIGNTQIYILDRHRNPVSIGVVGEIYIGGDGLARGYLNQPALTAEKFIADPFSTEPGARLYKTGDLARYLPNGDIEFLGRVDNQVKLRGYRIELGEIESVLGQHKAVQSSVVMAREDAPGDKRLVGYVVTQPGESFDAVEVRSYLQQKLPEYVIPSRMVVLDEMPLTPSGKVDRNALPAPDQDRPEWGNVYQPPCTPTEEMLAAIWGEVLKLDKVGISDNFFELGGHSLLATQVISRIRRAFSMDLPLRHMFESPTVAELAAMMTQTQSKHAGDAELAQMLLEVEAAAEKKAQKC